MICPKCSEKYPDDMPHCLWCETPNPQYSTVMEKLASEKAAELQEEAEHRARLQKQKEKISEDLEELGKISSKMLKSVIKLALFILVVLPNVLCLNIWIKKTFVQLSLFDPAEAFYFAAIFAIVIWGVLIFVFRKRPGLYSVILTKLSAFMVGLTVMLVIKKASSG